MNVRTGLTSLVLHNKSKANRPSLLHLPMFVYHSSSSLDQEEISHCFLRYNLKRFGKQQNVKKKRKEKCAKLALKCANEAQRAGVVWELGARGGVGAGGGTCTRDAFMHRIRHSEEAFDNFSTRNCFRNLKTLHVTFDDGADAEGLPAVWPTLREI